jgi:23S rRNA pseudouridine1911/1915/1917 synthase
MSERREVLRIEKSLPLERLDTFLRSHFPVVSRGAIQRLIEEGHITVNGEKVKPTHAPRAGEVVSVYWPEARTATAQPEEMPLDILYEDSDLLVLNKAAGVVVHPAAGHDEHTLVNALLHHCKGELSGIGGVARPGIVHRLDKDTSGCLVVAKNDAAHQSLATQLAERKVEKVYLGIVCGELPKLSGDIRAGIARHPTHRKRMAVVGGGREAWTSYRLLERLPATTLVEVFLHTGRTHQIRVHFQHLGFPLLGDPTYGQRPTARVTALTGYMPPRVMLHAWKLSFTHPRSGEQMKFEAPRPEDFAQALVSLREKGNP